jgi:drug/metabolite transporter (DMT)-like permease
VIYLGVFPSAIAYLLSNFALARLPACLQTAFLYLSPVLAALIAWAWRGEVPTVLTAVGGAVVIAGVVVVGRSQAQAKPRASGAPRSR